jgi:hypothetical protein
MAHFIAEAIRAHIGTSRSDADRALLAVVDKCEQIREESGIALGWAFANTFEGVIVRELNVAFPIDQADEVRRLLGH